MIPVKELACPTDPKPGLGSWLVVCDLVIWKSLVLLQPLSALQTQTCVSSENEVSACAEKFCLISPATYVYDPGPSLSQTTAKVNVHLLDAGAVLHYVLEQHLKRKEGRKELHVYFVVACARADGKTPTK